MAQMQWCGLLILTFWVMGGRASGSSNKRVEIGPGVHMPLMNLGGILDEHSDFGHWLKIGGRGIDTAWAYGAEVQRSVGHAIRDSDVPRSEVFLTTKVPCCTSATQYGCAKLADTGSSAQEFARETAAGNLEQLGVEFVDLLLLHSACDTLEDTVAAYAALEEVAANGKARAIGVSNFNASVMRAFLATVKTKPAVNQCGYSIGENSDRNGRNPETLRFDQALGITFSAFSPLGHLDNGIDVLRNRDVLSVAVAHKKIAAQVAMRWLVQQGIPTVTASSNPQHLEGDLDVFTFALSDAEMSLLGAIGHSETLIYA